MSFYLVLPPAEETIEYIKRAINWAYEFIGVKEFTLLCDQQHRSYYTRILDDSTILKYSNAMADSAMCIIYMATSIGRLGQHGEFDQYVYSCKARRAYVMELHGTIRKVRDLDGREWPALDAHVFNRLSNKSQHGLYYYFPYGYLFRYVGLGHINPYGFRVPDDYEKLAKRQKNHKVITFFGGSSTWSMFTLHGEMFQEVLQRKLNSWCSEKNLNLEFTVLNFGMHGHVVMNSIITYTLFVQNIKPDFVVTHDGWNDFLSAMLSDPFLLEDKSLTYQTNFEQWSHLVHNTHDIPTNHPSPSKAMKILNGPHSIIKAYIDRKSQFHDLVEALGAKHIWGLQPFVMSKSAPSEQELEYTKPLDKDNPMYHAYDKVGYIYDRFQTVKLPSKAKIANCHAYFKQFGADETLFGDTIHTLVLGDQKIAEFYFQFIIENFYPAQHVEQQEGLAICY